MAHLLRGDFGVAWSTLGIGYDGRIHGQPVGHMMLQAAGVTGSVILGGAVVLVLIAVPLALISARFPRSPLDRAVVAVSLIGISTHPLVIGLVLQLLFSVHWHWLAGGYCNFFPHRPPSATAPHFVATQPIAVCEGPKDWATHLILPWITFALFFVALYMRVLRGRLLETLVSHYVRTARAKGASEPRVLVRHALPNVVAPVLVMLAMDAGTAIGISIYIEVVYGLPGHRQPRPPGAERRARLRPAADPRRHVPQCDGDHRAQRTGRRVRPHDRPAHHIGGALGRGRRALRPRVAPV